METNAWHYTGPQDSPASQVFACTAAFQANLLMQRGISTLL